MHVQDNAVRVRETAQGSPDFFDRNPEALGDLVRIRNAPGRQQRLQVPIMDRGLDVGSHVSFLTPRRHLGKP
jgi:hypothetical protein